MAAYATPRPWLRQAVESALSQQGCSLELVVVDDGSPEPVADMLADFDDERLRLVRIEHGGVSQARNGGIDAARGSYIRFVDSDDWFPPASTSLLLRLAAGEPGGAIACGATRWCRQDLTPLFDWPAGCPREAAVACLLMRCTPLHHSMLFPAETVHAAGAWDPRLEVVHDWDFILRAVEHAPVVETREVVTWYRQHEGGVSRDAAATWRGSELTVARYFERHPEARAGRLATQAEAVLDLLAAELTRPRAPWLERRFWRALRRDPSAARTAYARLWVPRLQRLRLRLAGAIEA